jgi:peptidoglycan/xylan/chitin deacetylase (PgdA/CDA1 family)
MKNKYINTDIFKEDKSVCLALDFEQDFGGILDTASFEGLQFIPELIETLHKHTVPLTCFTQGLLIESHPEAIRLMSSADVEFELHTYSHCKRENIKHDFEIKKGKEVFVKYFQKEPLAYRSSCGVTDNTLFSALYSKGFKVDSSVIPSVRFGYYNNLQPQCKPYYLPGTQIVEFPVAILSPMLPIPLSLSYINLLGAPYLNLIRFARLPNIVFLSFHLHDLGVLDSSQELQMDNFGVVEKAIFHKIYKNNRSGMKYLDRLIQIFINKGYKFKKLEEIYTQIESQILR